ncbi:RHS repeat-associated core domain-containing protein [bacterium SCSIO 12643]|nr:RHS repeat-associated core domain-containing protein [bacterium SCSIO 12643]
MISTTDYYPFGSVQSGRSYTSDAHRYGFNGMENDNEIKGTSNSLDFGARIYDPRIGRWLSLDPLASEYPEISDYCYVADNPVIFIDEGGKYIRLSFESKQAYDSYVKKVNASLEGQFEVKFNLVTDDRLGYNFEVELVAIGGGSVSNLSEKGKAFYDDFNSAVVGQYIARMEVVWGDAETNGGSWITGKLDMADVEAFDDAGEGGLMSAGVIIHETIEQYKKAEYGLDPGEMSNIPQEFWSTSYPPEYNEAHDNFAIPAENRVNGNIRINIFFYLEKNGDTTMQEFDESPELGVNKVKDFHFYDYPSY